MKIRRRNQPEHEPQFPAPLEGYAATVELPEGHHVTIGELPPGTVVEVATWNGTGKPDESTRRFLLSADGPGLKRRTTRDQIEYRETTESVSRNVPVSDPIFGSASDLPSEKHDYQRSDVRQNKYIGLPKKLISITATFLVLTIFVGLFAAIGIRVAVPTQGAKTVFGDSRSSLILYKKSDSVAVGTPVIAKAEQAVVFGALTNSNPIQTTISLNGSELKMSGNSIAGQGFLVIPFIGSVLKPFINS